MHFYHPLVSSPPYLPVVLHMNLKFGEVVLNLAATQLARGKKLYSLVHLVLVQFEELWGMWLP